MTQARFLLPVVAVTTLVACGGGDVAPSTSNRTSQSTERSSGEGPTTGPTEARSADGGLGSTATAEGVNLDTMVEDVRVVCQAVLDAPQLAQYVTPIPSRVPLRMSADGPCRNLKLEKNGKPVVFDGGPRDLTITEVVLTGSGATAKIRYRGEGLTGEFELERSAGRFQVMKGNVAEH